MIHTRGYSTFSFLDGIGHPKKLVDHIKTLRMTSFALTEKWYMAGCIPTIQACQNTNPPLTPLVGVELGWCTDITPKSNPYGTITLLAISLKGLQTCMYYCTKAHQNLINGIPHITTQQFDRPSSGILILLGGHDTQLLHVQTRDISGHLTHLIEMFGKESLIIDFCSGGKKNMTDLINTKLREIKKQYNFLHVINNGFCYPHRDDYEIFCIGQAIKQGVNIKDIDSEQYINRHILSPDEREQIAKDYGFNQETINEARETSNFIEKKSSLSIDSGKTKFPIYESPQLIKNLYQDYLSQ